VTRKKYIAFIFVVLCSVHPLFAKPKFQPLKKDSGKIDVVYTWVDDRDPVWQKAYKKAKAAYNEQATPEAKVKSRFRNRDELKYSLRSIRAYAPFVHHIFIVTFGHKPSWLKSHSKITVVSHEKIFLNKEHLPTFNSQAIEANLHRINKLQERFIYFNDDVFLGRTTNERDFFSKHGKIKIFVEERLSPTGKVKAGDIGYVASWKNTNTLLDVNFGKKKRKILAHAPFSLRKSHFEQLENWVPTIFSSVSSHKFRSPYDYVMTCGFLQYFALYSSQADEGKIESEKIAFGSNKKVNAKNLQMLLDKRPHTFCVEDVSNQDSSACDEQLAEFFETYFPIKAPWEK